MTTWEEQRRKAREANKRETAKVVAKEKTGFNSEAEARYAEDAERIGTTGAYVSKDEGASK